MLVLGSLSPRTVQHPRHGMMALPTLDGSSLSIKEIKIIPNRHAQRPVSQAILDSVNSIINTNHCRYSGQQDPQPAEQKATIIQLSFPVRDAASTPCPGSRHKLSLM